MTIERLPEAIVHHPEEVEVPSQLGIAAVETEFKTPVTNDRGQSLVSSPAMQKLNIQLPATKGQLLAWVKGPISDSLTWFAAYWLRIIKKAVYFGWNLVMGQGSGGGTDVS